MRLIFLYLSVNNSLEGVFYSFIVILLSLDAFVQKPAFISDSLVYLRYLGEGFQKLAFS